MISNFTFATKHNKIVGFQIDDIFDPDVHAPTELMCFEAIFTHEILNHLVTEINNYGELRSHRNSPASKRSRFGIWKPTTQAEIFKYIAVVAAIGIDKRPHIRDFLGNKRYFP